ncbi:MAG TPA: ATP synthase F0 subunit B [Polyangia bacterium]|nr:ATP synthase F0 subunit B [Polyangia bacterium]
MRRLFRALPLAVLLSSGAAFAQEGRAEHAVEAAEEHDPDQHAEHHEEIDVKTLALQLLNFGVLLFILIKFGGGAINKSLRARHDQLKTDMEEAARLRTAAELRFKEQEKRLENLEHELEAMRQAILKEAEHEKARIIAAAEERAKRVQDETRFQLEQQVKEAELRFRAEVAQAALKIADELLRRSVNGGDEQRLVQNFVAELGATRSQERS